MLADGLLTQVPCAALAKIASAPADVQKRALTSRGWQSKRHAESEPPDWTAVAAACTMETIPRTRAVFDVEKAGVVFDERVAVA